MNEHKVIRDAIIDEWLAEMEGYIERGDEEIQHINADRLLLDIIETLSILLPRDQLAKIDRIRKLYDDIDKWYA